MNGGKTGAPPGLLQDDSRKLHKWFASRLDARQVIRNNFGDLMTRHTSHGSIPSVWQDDGFGTLHRITFQQLIARIESGWREL
jgi:hypothetical protein